MLCKQPLSDGIGLLFTFDAPRNLCCLCCLCRRRKTKQTRTTKKTGKANTTSMVRKGKTTMTTTTVQFPATTMTAFVFLSMTSVCMVSRMSSAFDPRRSVQEHMLAVVARCRDCRPPANPIYEYIVNTMLGTCLTPTRYPPPLFQVIKP